MPSLRWFFVTLLALSLVGCSGDSQVVSSSPASLPAPPERVNGQVELAGARAAQVRLLSPAGAPLSPAVATDAQGLFRLETDLPADFRIEATTDLGEVFRSDYRGEPDPQTLMVNPVTDIVSAYLDVHPQASLAQATAEVKELLSLPVEFDVRYDVGDSSFAPFEVPVYLQTARASGGLGPGSSSFPFQLARVAGTAVPRMFTVEAAAPGILTALCTGLATGAAEEVGEKAVGWILRGLANRNQNSNESNNDAQIQEQLQQLSIQVAQLSQQVAQFATQADYLAQANALFNDITLINSTSAVIANATSPSALSEITVTIGQLSAMINQFHVHQVGGPEVGPGMMPLLQKDLGFPPPQASQGKPSFYSNRLPNVGYLFEQYQLYATWQTLLGNCIVELMHVQLPPQLTEPAPLLDGIAANLKTQQQLLPPPAPQDSLVLAGSVNPGPYNTIWVDAVYGPDTYNHANAMAQQANQFQLGGLTGWRVANSEDYYGSFQGQDFYDGSVSPNLGQLAAFPNLQQYLIQKDIVVVTADNSTNANSFYYFGGEYAGVLTETGPSWVQGTNSNLYPYMLCTDAVPQGGWIPLLASLTGLRINLVKGSEQFNTMVVQVRATGTFSSQNFGNYTMDVTPYVTWTDDSASVRVSNYPGSEGVLLYSNYLASPFNVTATFRGLASGNQTVTNSTQVPVPSGWLVNNYHFVYSNQIDPPSGTLIYPAALQMYASLFGQMSATAVGTLVPPLYLYGLNPDDTTNSSTWTVLGALGNVTAGVLQMLPGTPSQNVQVSNLAYPPTTPGNATYRWIGQEVPQPSPSPIPLPSPSPSPQLQKLALSPSGFTLIYSKGERSVTYTLRATDSNGGISLYPNQNAVWQTSDPGLTSVVNGTLTVTRRPEREHTVTVNASVSLPQGGTLTSNNSTVLIKDGL